VKSGCAELISCIETKLTNKINYAGNRLQSFEDFVRCSLKNINDIISTNKIEEELIKYVHAVRLDFEVMSKNLVDLKLSNNIINKQNEVKK
jgi:hypothetical protein